MGQFVNYQDELKKMKPSQKELMLDTIKLAGIARMTSGNWQQVFLNAKNKTISPRVKSLLQAFADTADIDSAIDAFMSVMPQK